MGCEMCKLWRQKEILYQNEGKVNYEDITSFPLLERVPPEIWHQILGYLNDHSDCISAAETFSLWKQILDTTKPSWLFGPVFPFLVDQLSKSDILRCRLICKKWRYGVDDFLENNLYHRPALEVTQRDVNGTVYKIYHTDMRLQHLEHNLKTKKLAYIHLFKAEKMTKLICEAIDHPHCPLIGRSIDILESNTAPLPAPPNAQFMQTFGHHIHFLRLVVENFSSMESLTRVWTAFSALPNLKKLKLITTIVSSQQVPKDVWDRHVENLKCGRDAKITHSKLEHLDLIILPNQNVNIVEALLDHFGNDNLKALDINVLPEAPAWDSMSNLTYLTVSLDTQKRLLQLLEVKAYLQRLSIRLHGPAQTNTLFMVARHFKHSLRQFNLSLCAPFFIGQELSKPCTSLAKLLSPFTCRDSLRGFPYLRRVLISTWRPISFNFLCEVRNLQNLHIFMKEMNNWNEFLKDAFPWLRKAEKLDLLMYLKMLSSSERLLMYESNVWKVFPKLGVMTVQVCSVTEHANGGEWEYTRDIYDKIQSAKSRK